MRTYAIIDGKLLIKDSGVYFWFTRAQIEREVKKAREDLQKWQGYLDMFNTPQTETDKTPGGAHQTTPDNCRG